MIDFSSKKAEYDATAKPSRYFSWPAAVMAVLYTARFFWMLAGANFATPGKYTSPEVYVPIDLSPTTEMYTEHEPANTGPLKPSAFVAVVMPMQPGSVSWPQIASGF